jgi:hypothetical protein
MHFVYIFSRRQDEQHGLSPAVVSLVCGGEVLLVVRGCGHGLLDGFFHLRNDFCRNWRHDDEE